MMSPLISVIVPVYNVEAYLGKCIESIIHQTYTNLEIILVDDGSPDRCGEICDYYAARDSRVNVIHKLGGGVSSARNAGLELTKGDYITFVDADDWIDEELYEELVNVLCEDDDVLLFDHRGMDMEGNVIPDKHNPLQEKKIAINNAEFESIRYLAHIGRLGYVWNKLYKADVIKKLRFPNIRLCEDTYFCRQLLGHIKVLHCTGICGYNYLQRTNSALHASNVKNIEDFIRFEEKFFRNTMIPQLNIRHNMWLYNKTMLTLLCDSIVRDIMSNTNLTDKDRERWIKKIFDYSPLRKRLKLRYCGKKLSVFLVICLKAGQWKFFYKCLKYYRK